MSSGPSQWEIDRDLLCWLMRFGWQVPRSAVGPVETQGRQWYSFCRAWRPENHKSQWYKFQSKFESEGQKSDVPAWKQLDRESSFKVAFIYLFIYLGYSCFTLLGQFLRTVKGIRHVRACSVAQSSTTLCESMDYSLPDSSVNGIFQVIILEWVAISYPRESSQSGD